jgi:hypothetical protein
MSATLVELKGTVGIHGIAADETGLIIRSLKDKTRKASNYLKNRLGNRIGRADYDHSIEITMEGEITATSGWSQKVSSSLAITNAITTAHLPTGAAAGQTLIDEVERGREREGWQDISVTAEMLPAFPIS